ncbi:hypothetical protein VIGAN_11171400, partial [Vigna angularis var. angularis]
IFNGGFCLRQCFQTKVVAKQMTGSFKTHVNGGFGVERCFETAEPSGRTMADTTLVNGGSSVNGLLSVYGRL